MFDPHIYRHTEHASLQSRSSLSPRRDARIRSEICRRAQLQDFARQASIRAEFLETLVAPVRKVTGIIGQRLVRWSQTDA